MRQMAGKTDRKIEIHKELDFCFAVAGEKKEGLGEDSFLIDRNSRAALISVFDGLGGSGARLYPEFGNRTGAYIASRAAAEAAMEWFTSWTREPERSGRGRETGGMSAGESLKRSLDIKLAEFQKSSQSASLLRSSMTRAFPTTLAAEMITRRPERPGVVQVTFLWCGDSRCYVLETGGLRQVSVDDLSVTDAMQNLQEDAAMLNVVSASHRYEIHERRMEIRRPCIFLTATDGCFGYFKSPMEFEKILLGTLINSRSVSEWKSLLANVWNSVAGDDFTICMAGIGFGSFEEVQNSYRLRQSKIEKLYPYKVENSREILLEQWEEYRKEYEKYQKTER